MGRGCEQEDAEEPTMGRGGEQEDAQPSLHLFVQNSDDSNTVRENGSLLYSESEHCFCSFVHKLTVSAYFSLVHPVKTGF